MKVHFNNKEISIGSEQELSEYIELIDTTEKVETWFNADSGQSICLLKSGENTLLMYLRFPEDVGFVSGKTNDAKVLIEFTIGNGQVDEYPQSWCIDNEAAYKALAYFYVNSGQKSPHIDWQIV
ncbi:hypothetical protein OLMES_3207 [Oleiphilus messinensis]|uniref:Uncharacterized protein n=1 Tax=Oleiphilus messinensis TaxID=141451 RepID=A0A1Y0I9R2_9GAMM|nr:hypothetical protein [Oleiphilus messinensis]ARU57248.1 hypothetical protein OLMES_3207 [Oleiphilus messinensis]